MFEKIKDKFVTKAKDVIDQATDDTLSQYCKAAEIGVGLGAFIGLMGLYRKAHKKHRYYVITEDGKIWEERR